MAEGLKHAMSLPYHEFEDQRSGETLSILQKEIGNIILTYREAQASLENFGSLMNKAPEAKPENPGHLGQIQTLEFDHVAFKHQTASQNALNDISFK
ncbi:unnamed protein product, partial [Darwinula stevensoni]